MKRIRWASAIAVSSAATAIAMWLQNILRDTWQIRSLPERVMEWLLLFVPLDLFERGLAQFGTDAKEVGLLGTVIGMLVSLVAIGTLALRAGWTSRRLMWLGLTLWLLTMAVVMPVTGAGFFATGLLIAPLLINAGYLLVFLGYASTLMAGRLILVRQPSRRVSVERRAFLTALIGGFAAGGLAVVIGREGGQVASTLPLAAAPTPAPGPPTEAATVQPTAVVVPTPTLEPMPNPPPPRRITRDKDGSLTAAGRPKGMLAPMITTNDDFYVVTKNAVQDPIVDAANWRLVIDGEVRTPVQLDYRTLRALPSVEVTKTLECISNFTSACNLTTFGCDLISTARWRGARLMDVLDLAGGLKPGAMGLALLSLDEFSAGLLSDVASDSETLVVYEMNGQPLPREHGFPARLLVPGRYGMKDPKWLAGIRAMTHEYAGWYEQRNWNRDGIVKTMSRIDMPVDGAVVSPGAQRIAGIAYGGDRGISKVEWMLNDGPTWQSARIIEPMPGKDAQVRWEATFEVPAGGKVVVTVRATDGTGEVQTEEFQLPQPNGASGRHSITVSAA